MADLVSPYSCPNCGHCLPNQYRRRNDGSSSSEASVGTTLLLPDKSADSQAVSSSARFRGSGRSGGGQVAGVQGIELQPLQTANGHGQGHGQGQGQVVVDVGGSGVGAGLLQSGADDDDDDDDDDICVADLVATNLEELNSGRHAKLKYAFDDWENTFNLFQKRREYKEAQRDASRNEIYQLIGFYIVFQGVIFTAVAQASVLRCQNWWTSFMLSLLTSIVTIAGVLQKLSQFWALETTIASEKASSKVLKSRLNFVKSIGPNNFKFREHAKDGVKEKVELGFYVRIYRFTVISVLIVFSVMFLISSWRILCVSGHAPLDG